MLSRVAGRLIEQGFDEITINVHHFADQVISYVKADEALSRLVSVSDESDQLLDTGGGLLHASSLLSKDDRPFLVHNVDILSNADLRGLMDMHLESGNHVSLLVSDRKSDRKLVFDAGMHLKGWLNLKSGEVRPASFRMDDAYKPFSFSGIYVVSPVVFSIMRQNGFSSAFPIMDFLLAGIPELRIGGIVQHGLEIIDIGKPDALHRANLTIQ